MTAMLDDVPFRINPQSVAWPYTMKVASHDTIGGRVIQLLGVVLGDLTIEGVFGAGGPTEQLTFVDRIVRIIQAQLPTSRTSPPRPVRFLWPERNWDFWCYVKAIKQSGSNSTIEAANEIINPGYRLTMFIQEDNGSLTKAAQDSAAASFLSRLSAGMGWKQSEWNGPLGSLQDVLNGQNFYDYVLNDAKAKADIFQQQVDTALNNLTHLWLGGASTTPADTTATTVPGE